MLEPSHGTMKMRAMRIKGLPPRVGLYRVILRRYARYFTIRAMTVSTMDKETRYGMDMIQPANGGQP